MTPLKVTDYLSQKNPATRPVQLMDLREFGMQHAAPREDDHVFLTMRVDPRTGTLLPAR